MKIIINNHNNNNSIVSKLLENTLVHEIKNISNAVVVKVKYSMIIKIIIIIIYLFIKWFLYHFILEREK